MSEKIDTIISQIEELNVLDLNTLVKTIEDKWGVSAAAAAAPMMMPGGGGGGEAAAEKTEFDVTLKEVGAKKINVIKAVREVTEPRPQGGQGARRRRSRASSRKAVNEGRGRGDQEEVRGRPAPPSTIDCSRVDSRSPTVTAPTTARRNAALRSDRATSLCVSVLRTPARPRVIALRSPRRPRRTLRASVVAASRAARGPDARIPSATEPDEPQADLACPTPPRTRRLLATSGAIRSGIASPRFAPSSICRT